MASGSFARILEPGYFGKLKTRNRIIKTANGTSFIEPTGFVSDRMIAYYENMAKGGVHRTARTEGSRREPGWRFTTGRGAVGHERQPGPGQLMAAGGCLSIPRRVRCRRPMLGGGRPRTDREVEMRFVRSRCSPAYFKSFQECGSKACSAELDSGVSPICNRQSVESSLGATHAAMARRMQFCDTAVENLRYGTRTGKSA